MADEIDFTFLGKQIERTRALVNDVRENLTGMVKCEISGRLANFETKMETKIGDEFDALRADLPNIVAETPSGARAWVVGTPPTIVVVYQALATDTVGI